MFWGGVALRNKGRPVVPASVHPAIDWRLQLGLVEGGGANITHCRSRSQRLKRFEKKKKIGPYFVLFGV